MGEVAESAEFRRPPPRTHFVLVHGLGGGAWCWYKLRVLMESSGYCVSCIDLKSSGIDPTNADSVLCFDDYNKPLMDLMASLPETEQVILVGHSAGGLSLTQAMREFVGKIRAAVFVTATMLRSGFCTDQDVKDGVPDLSEFGDDVYDVSFGLGFDKPPTSAVLKKEFQRKIIYQMSPHEDSTLAAMLLKPGPMLALQTARFAEENGVIDKVPRVFIKAVHDNVLRLEQQEAMIRKWPPAETYTLECDHSPFFSATFLLYGLLVKIAATF
ncbi:hypothetical protein SAY87_018338 [Trapa incisa]|uniref:AB hydrolase-1 domain-containing protein n=1 Tax=Trapa incisa TaxID=236973 RepID=A0AAN7L391_9MYRT|nr:hypothetical protein SAY87_018338 [Trapa incisa]